jgi:Tol biopolymer transport system component
LTESDIYIIRPNGGGLRKVVDGGNEPDWSPTGERIVFIDAVGMVTTVRPDGTGRRTLRAGRSPAFSPDGHRIVYLSRDARPRLMVMGSGGKRPRSVLTVPPGGRGTMYDPDWQPLPLTGAR